MICETFNEDIIIWQRKDNFFLFSAAQKTILYNTSMAKDQNTSSILMPSASQKALVISMSTVSLRFVEKMTTNLGAPKVVSLQREERDQRKKTLVPVSTLDH